MRRALPCGPAASAAWCCTQRIAIPSSRELRLRPVVPRRDRPSGRPTGNDGRRAIFPHVSMKQSADDVVRGVRRSMMQRALDRSDESEHAWTRPIERSGAERVSLVEADDPIRSSRATRDTAAHFRVPARQEPLGDASAISLRRTVCLTRTMRGSPPERHDSMKRRQRCRRREPCRDEGGIAHSKIVESEREHR